MSLNKVLTYAIFKIQSLGIVSMRSWKRRKINSIQDQTQAWLFGSEYFYSSHTQEKRTDDKELARRKNQDEVREEYADLIKQYLDVYRQIADCIKQFFPNYSAVKHDGFKLSKTLDRLFDYHLVSKNTDEDPRPGHDYNKELDPNEYWKRVIKSGVTRENFNDLVNNELVREISQPIARYYSLRDSLTGWYIKKIIRCREWMTDTTQVFYSSYKFKDLSVEKLCEIIRLDFNSNEMFDLFGITQELIEKAIKSTLNESGRKKKYTEWYNANKHQWRAMDLKFKHPAAYHLEILGLPENATKDDIKKAFRKKSLEVHPDIIGGDGKEFIELTKSFDFLMNKG